MRADHAITITNLGGEERTASVSIQPGTSEPVIIEVQVPPASSETIDLVDHAQGPAVAALVEVDGGDVAVSHQHVGDTGIDSGPCASSSSDVWHFAWGDTSVDAAEVIALFNPFPGAAVVDLRFSTADGIREPRALTGLVVPGHSVIVADVSAEVTRRDQVAATVTARSGRVVAERIQVADGTERANDLPTRLGLAVDLGTPAPALMWAHPHARFSATTGQQVVVYNPTDEPAEVDVEVALDDDVVGGVEPFQLSVRPRSAETIRLADEPRLADVFGEDTGRFSLVIRSVNGVPVVAEVVTTLATPGWTASPGGNVVGTTTVFGAPNLGEPSSNQLVLSALHADEPTVVRLVAFVDGEREVVEEVSIDPGSRLEIDLVEAGLDADADALVVESSAPVAVELLTIWPDPGGLSIRTGVVRFDGAVRVFDLLG